MLGKKKNENKRKMKRENEAQDSICKEGFKKRKKKGKRKSHMRLG